MADNKPDVTRDRLGNIEQIRDVLFGQKAQEYDQQFTNYDRRLDKVETDLTQLQIETRDRLRSLQDTFSTELRNTLDSLEKKLKYLSLTTHETTSNLQQQLQDTNGDNDKELTALSKSVDDRSALLKEQLAETREQFDTDLQTLKEQLFQELEKGFSFLKESKVSRAVLAEVLFEMCIKVKGSDVFPAMESEEAVQTSFLLPDEQSE
ncbi:MAG: hypothetical protein WBB82_17925 [Limnothrix sp.]